VSFHTPGVYKISPVLYGFKKPLAGMHIQTILQSQVLFGLTRPALRPWLRKFWPPSRSAFKRRAIGRKRCGDGSNFRGERPGKHLGGFHDGWFIEGSLEVKLPTIWTDEKQSRAEAERRERLEERRVEEKE